MVILHYRGFLFISVLQPPSFSLELPWYHVFMNTTVTVTEIFVDIQGESTWAGLPCIFIRLAGCNLSCTWCDTPSAHECGQDMTLDAILARVNMLSLDLVEITGGEPLLQEGCPSLAELLVQNDFTVLCETNGSLSIDLLPSEVIRIMDVKCPASGQSNHMDWVNIKRLLPHDEVKFVIQDRADYDWSKDIVEKYVLQDRCRAVHFSPVFGVLDPCILATWIVDDRLDVRLHLQIHKYLDTKTKRSTMDV